MAGVERLVPGWSLPDLDLNESEWGCGTSDASRFKVRAGPDYEHKKRKEPSLEFMYDLKAVDNFKYKHRVFPIASLYQDLELDEHANNFSHPVVPPVFIVTLQLPLVSASLFGSAADGETAHVVAFFQIKPETIAALQDLDNSDPCYKLFVEWCTQAEKDPKFRGRFKFMGRLRGEFSAAGLPSMLQPYNGKPVLITQSGTFIREASNKFIEMNINVFVFNYMARKGLGMLKDKVVGLDADFGVTIEARGDAEMPERLLLAMRFRNVPFLDAEELPEAAYDWLVAHVDDQFKDKQLTGLPAK